MSDVCPLPVPCWPNVMTCRLSLETTLRWQELLLAVIVTVALPPAWGNDCCDTEIVNVQVCAPSANADAASRTNRRAANRYPASSSSIRF